MHTFRRLPVAAVDAGAHRLDVRVPAAVGAAVRVRDGHAEARTLATDVADGSHRRTLLGVDVHDPPGETRSRLSRVPARVRRRVARAPACRYTSGSWTCPDARRRAARAAGRAAAVAALERHRAEIDRINVFPVADRDTGTNLLLTMRAAAARRAAGSRRAARGRWPSALARGALLGARGNSGVILSQVLRGVAEAVAAGAEGAGGAGAVLADALARGARLADEAAVAAPAEGTVLTVLAAAAAAARRPPVGPARRRRGGRRRRRAAALRATTGAAARAGPRRGRRRRRARARRRPRRARRAGQRPGAAGPDAVAGAAPRRLRGRRGARRRAARPAPPASTTRSCTCSTARRRRVAALRAGWTGSATRWPWSATGAGRHRDLERARALHRRRRGDRGRHRGGPAAPHHGHPVRRPGRPRAGPTRFVRARAVLVVVVRAGAGRAGPRGRRGRAAARLPRRTSRDRVDEAELAAALAGTGARHVVLLPGDPALTPVAERAADAARRAGQEVAGGADALGGAGAGRAGRARPARRPGRRRRGHGRGRGRHPHRVRCGGRGARR